MKGKETYEYVNHRLTKLQSWFLDESDNTWKEGNYKTFEYSDDTHNVSRMTFTNPFFGPEGTSTTEEYKYISTKSAYSTAPEAVLKWYRLLEMPTDKALLTITYENGDQVIYQYTYRGFVPASRSQYIAGDVVENLKYTYSCD
jgi:hypothetical protein